ncbi:MAG: cell division protein SepF [Lachnospiraceae bacterium]|nr:cell division protein SepF [Lachnospiraceae bacterium]MBR1877285.1 cell division protein SepF [Lachnospiraceae bacterium]
MGFFDKVVNTLRIGDEDYDDYEYEDEDEDIVVSRRRSSRNSSIDDDDEEDFRPISKSKVTPMPRTRKSAFNNSGMEVCVIKPTSVEDSKAVVDTLLENHTVFINLEGIPTEVAQRIMDYTSGANAALDGNLQKISRNIFIVTPRSVDISGDFQDLLSGSINMYDNRK